MELKKPTLGLLLVLLEVVFISGANAEKKTQFDAHPFFAYGVANLSLAQPESDKVSGAVYQKNMRTPIIGALGVGGSPVGSTWLGIRYEYWFAKRELTLSGVSRTDSLNLQLIGPEVGLIRGNPRVAYLFAAGFLFPIAQSVSSSSNGLYSTPTAHWNYQVRSAIELKCSKSLAVQFESGYRWVKIKNLNQNGTPFISGGSPLDLSGPFVGMGIGLFF